MRYFLAFLLVCAPLSALAALGPAETITPEQLRAEYAASKLKILIVPGHDLVHSGTQFGSGKNLYKEGELTLALGYALQKYFAQDAHIHTLVSRGVDGDYADWLKEYVEDHGSELAQFRKEHVAATQAATGNGLFVATTTVSHNVADLDTRTYLFAVNKYANDNGYDLVLHIHFNDYAGRKSGEVGEYTGFTIYVPDPQFSNSRASVAVAVSVRDALAQFMSGSTLPAESSILVPDQDLVATGEFGTRDGASFLVEYSYIYEQSLRTKETRASTLKQLAYESYMGIEQFFNPTLPKKIAADALSHVWTTDLGAGAKGSADLLALQYALLAVGLYPAPGATLGECPLTGTFGSCTHDSLVLFQRKYLGYGQGEFGPKTRALLNKMFSKSSH